MHKKKCDPDLRLKAILSKLHALTCYYYEPFSVTPTPYCKMLKQHTTNCMMLVRYMNRPPVLLVTNKC